MIIWLKPVWQRGLQIPEPKSMYCCVCIILYICQGQYTRPVAFFLDYIQQLCDKIWSEMGTDVS